MTPVPIVVHDFSPKEWSYACRCLRCRWEQWWHEGDNHVCSMPTEPHPDGDFRAFFNERDSWSGWTHPNA